MARIRTVKPDFFYDEELTKLPHAVRLFFIGLWGMADKEGRLEDRPAFIRANVFPYEPEFDAEGALSALSPKFVERYEAEGKRLLWIRTFKKHQRINGKESESVSRFPSAPGEAEEKQPGSIGEATGKPLGAQEGEEERELGKDKINMFVQKDGQDGWPEFWTAYPRKTAKQAALKAFRKVSPNPAMLEIILKAVAAQRRQESWTKDGGCFVPHASTWLNGKRWEDEVVMGKQIVGSQANDKYGDSQFR
jgi:hypothetical protein